MYVLIYTFSLKQQGIFLYQYQASYIFSLKGQVAFMENLVFYMHCANSMCILTHTRSDHMR